MLCCRQVGKSLTTAVKAIHHILTTPYATVLLVSGAQQQSDEIFRKAMIVYDTLGCPIKPVKRRFTEIELQNGARMVALPNNPSTVRSRSDVTLLILDEAAQIPHEMIVAVLPMILASSGHVIMLSTPNGEGNYFHTSWIDPDGRWEKIKVTAADCSRFDPVVVEEIRHQLGPLAASQELDCNFLRSAGAVFSISSIDRAFQSDVPAIHDF